MYIYSIFTSTTYMFECIYIWYIYLYTIIRTFLKVAQLKRPCLKLPHFCSVRKFKHLSDSFPIQNGLKQGDALSPLLFNFALEDAIRKEQETQVGLKLNGTHQLLAYADNVNLLGDNIDTILLLYCCQKT
jgi:hypothetical protein